MYFKKMIPNYLFIILTILYGNMVRVQTENVNIKEYDRNLKENIFTGNNTKNEIVMKNEMQPNTNNELIPFSSNQLLPYLHSKLPIPISLINQLRKYNINKNILHKMYEYNLLKRELNIKLIENEINKIDYNKILNKQFKNLFSSINSNEKNNFINLINYLKLFNYDNKRLYNALTNNKNDLKKILNNKNKHYLPFISNDNNIPELIKNNKINKELHNFMNKNYKINSENLYDKLIGKINPKLAANNNILKLNQANNHFHRFKLLRDRINHMTAFRNRYNMAQFYLQQEKHKKKEHIHDKKEDKHNPEELKNVLNDKIFDLKLLKEIEKEKDRLLNKNIKELTANENNKKSKLTVEDIKKRILDLYIFLSMPNVFHFLPDTIKYLPYIKKTNEEINHYSYIEAGALYNKLMNQNLHKQIKNIESLIKDNKPKHLEKYFDKLHKMYKSNENKEKPDSNKEHKIKMQEDYDDPLVMKKIKENKNEIVNKMNMHEEHDDALVMKKIKNDNPIHPDHFKDNYNEYDHPLDNGPDNVFHREKAADNIPEDNNKNNNNNNREIHGNHLHELLNLKEHNKNLVKDIINENAKLDDVKNEYNIHGNELFNLIQNKQNMKDSENNNEQNIIRANQHVNSNFKIDGKNLINLLRNNKQDNEQDNLNNMNEVQEHNNNVIHADSFKKKQKKERDEQKANDMNNENKQYNMYNHKISDKQLFDLLKQYNTENNQNNNKMINGIDLYNLLNNENNKNINNNNVKNENVDQTKIDSANNKPAIDNNINSNTDTINKNKVSGFDLFKSLKTNNKDDDLKAIENFKNGREYLNKVYGKLYERFLKDNKAMFKDNDKKENTNTNDNVVWNNLNVEIPNIFGNDHNKDTKNKNEDDKIKGTKNDLLKDMFLNNQDKSNDNN